MPSPPNDDVLPIVDGTISISPSLIPGGPFQAALALATGGTPLVVASPTRTATATQVTITGTATFLGQAGAAVTGTFATDATGAVTGGVLAVQVAGGAAGSTGWSFATSFPTLPAFLPSLNGSSAGNALTTLSFGEASFVVTNAAGGTDRATGAPLGAGMTFAGTAGLGGLLGVVEGWVAPQSSVVFSGPVVLPSGSGPPPPPIWSAAVYPWMVTPLPPGIFLGVPLVLSYTIPGTSLSLSQGALQLYTPTSADWATANPGWFASLALGATLAIPSAGVQVEIWVDDPVSNPASTITGFFSGVSLGSLAGLADLSGSADLAALLPRDLSGPLSQLSLQAMAVMLTGDFAVAGVSASVGIPNGSTSVLPGFTIDSLVACFGVDSPFSAPSPSLELDGAFDLWGTPTTVSVLFPQGFVTASLPDGVTVNFSTAAAGLALPTGLPNLTINQLDIAFDLSGDFSFFASMAENPGWTLELVGPVAVTATDVVASVQRASGTLSGGVSGTFQFGSSLILSVNLILPGSFQLTAALPSVTLQELIADLTNLKLPLPDGFDLTFTDSSVLVQDQGGAPALMLITTVQGFGTVMLALEQAAEGSWGVAAGLNIDQPSALASLPGLSLLGSFGGFTLQQLVLVVSSLTSASFVFPALSVFSSAGLPVPATGVILPAQAQGVVEGLNVYGLWALDSSDPQQGLLASLLEIDATLGITLQISVPPETDTRFFVSLTTNGQGEPLELAGQPLSCEIGVQIQGGEPSIFLEGQMTCTIQGTQQTFQVELAWATNGMFLMGSMTGTQAVTFGGIELADLMVMIGIDWEEIPSLGFSATLAAAGIDASLTILLDSVNPAQSVLAGAISPVNLEEVFDALTEGAQLPSALGAAMAQVELLGTGSATIDGSLQARLNGYEMAAVVAALNATRFTVSTELSNLLLVLDRVPADQPVDQVTSWGLTDLSTGLHYQLTLQGQSIAVALDPQFQVVPATVVMGGMTYNQGIFVTGGLEVEGYVFEITVKVSPGQGILVDGSINEPIVIGSAALFALESTAGTTGPSLSLSTYSTIDPSTGEPVQPHFYLDGKVVLLGASVAIQVNVTADGFSFDIDTDFLDVVTASLSGSYSSAAGLAVLGSLTIGATDLNLGPLGSIPLDTEVSASLSISASSDVFSATLGGSLELFGHTFGLPTYTLDIGIDSMENMAPLILHEVVQGLTNFYEADVQAWVDDVNMALIIGIEDIESTLSTVFQLGENEINQLLADAQACATTAAAYAM